MVGTNFWSSSWVGHRPRHEQRWSRLPKNNFPENQIREPGLMFAYIDYMGIFTLDAEPRPSSSVSVSYPRAWWQPPRTAAPSSCRRWWALSAGRPAGTAPTTGCAASELAPEESYSREFSRSHRSTCSSFSRRRNRWRRRRKTCRLLFKYKRKIVIHFQHCNTFDFCRLIYLLVTKVWWHLQLSLFSKSLSDSRKYTICVWWLNLLECVSQVKAKTEWTPIRKDFFTTAIFFHGICYDTTSHSSSRQHEL